MKLTIRSWYYGRMLYFIYGEDTQKGIEKAKGLVTAMLSKKPNASLFKLTNENWSVGELQELIGGQGLFSEKYIVQVSRVLDNDEIKEQILDYVSMMQESENIFIWTEGKMDAKTLKQIEKHAEKVTEYSLKSAPKKFDFNIFALSDALGNRDKKNLWMLYLKALEVSAPEEIHGTLFWQAKSMVLAHKSKDANESGLKPFVYTKSKKFASNFNDEELNDLPMKLIRISHDARRGKNDFSIALERFILTI